ncbi:MAG: dockerin type I domain-containing protein [Candidatus Bathyarchaeia archaeon]
MRHAVYAWLNMGTMYTDRSFYLPCGHLKVTASFYLRGDMVTNVYTSLAQLTIGLSVVERYHGLGREFQLVQFTAEGGVRIPFDNEMSFSVEMDVTLAGYYGFLVSVDACCDSGVSSPMGAYIDFGSEDHYIRLQWIRFEMHQPMGDLNEDGVVDNTDLSVMYHNLGSNNSTCDLNLDGKVNYKDLALEFGYYLGWQTRYYTYVPPAIEITATAFGQAINQIRQKYHKHPIFYNWSFHHFSVNCLFFKNKKVGF